jgi:hypothetical protein
MPGRPAHIRVRIAPCFPKRRQLSKENIKAQKMPPLK